MKTRIAIGAAVAGGLFGLFFWWSNRNSSEILPAGPNPFVERVTISPIVENPVPFDDTIEISANHGAYVRVELHPFEDFPETFEGRDVAAPRRWPISFAIYRPGRPSGPEAVELLCHAPGNQSIERQKRGEANQTPPPRLVSAGFPHNRSKSNGYVGEPDMPQRQPNEITFWTFIVPTDEENPVGRYVYEIRLYPTARWVSKIRGERGEPLVLKRGLLIVSDEEEDDPPAHDA